MRLDEAWGRVALAGRELGSGPMKLLERFQYTDAWCKGRFPDLEPDDRRRIALGIVIGRVQAEDPTALRILEEVERDWRRDP